ncbi:WhiB family transcriptional regulator [Streptomyces javensis]|uniref:WhiB family transcriptional regulator n=1 Tax=Streptomyces javensis TaxID=114698 RepID=UPI00337D58B5
MISHSDEKTALSELEAHPAWPSRSCAATDPLGEPLVDPDIFYRPSKALAAKRVCTGCPVRIACRAYALGGSGWWEAYGVWGGMTSEERRAERRAAKKRQARVANRGDRPTPVPNWTPSTTQRALLDALRKQPDVREAASLLAIPYPNTRWVYSQVCRQLGFYPDELSVPDVLEAAARATAARSADNSGLGATA